MQELDQKLIQYGKSDMYPFHMPGHKRQKLDFANPYEIDITEIEGFDNLHHAEGILKEAQTRAAELYGAKKSFYLVNGSTCGILAAICACTLKHDKILIARNSHKAVFHAVFLNELQAEYLYPERNTFGIQGQITPEQVEEALQKNPDISAVLVTSPTYEGVVSDIRKIAEIAHAHQVPLIVDEAHGAHFGFSKGFPEEAGKNGADVVIMSLHKTLPSFTQTALLHIFSDRVDAEKVEKYLGIFETSSPSYILMAGMEQCIRYVREEKDSLFSEYEEKLEQFYDRGKKLKHLHVLCRENFSKEPATKKIAAYDWDPSKIVIFSKEDTYTGAMLHRELLEKYHLEMEMVSAEYVLAMTSIMDTEEGFERLAQALEQIDDRLEKAMTKGQYSDSKEHLVASMYRPKKAKLQIAQAENLASKEVSFQEAVGQISAEYIYLYPPGIPVIVPGEVLEQELLEKIERCMELGLSVEGAKNIWEKRIKIVYF
ncbi:MAG: aminotransferase class I/II-fold pyridoxal phosphate-dependent enzyme [Roseburia sp.]